MISTPLVEGFDEVYKRNYTRLSQYAFHIIHDKGDAEDLANEAFLVYYQHADEMDIENPDAYLFKILRNLIGNYIKRRDLHPTLSLDILEETADIQSSPEPLEYLLPQGLSQDERDKVHIGRIRDGSHRAYGHDTYKYLFEQFHVLSSLRAILCVCIQFKPIDMASPLY